MKELRDKIGRFAERFSVFIEILGQFKTPTEKSDIELIQSATHSAPSSATASSDNTGPSKDKPFIVITLH